MLNWTTKCKSIFASSRVHEIMFNIEFSGISVRSCVIKDLM